MEGLLGGPPPGQLVWMKQIVAPGPSTVFVFLDEHEKSIFDGTFAIYRDPSTLWVNLPADRHSQGANLSFADGHVQRLRWNVPKIFKAWGQQAVSPADQQDLKTLQQLLPTPPE